jgi:hypothetical protein
MVSIISSRLAPYLLAALAWKARQPSQRAVMPMASAISSLVLASSAPGADGGLGQHAESFGGFGHGVTQIAHAGVGLIDEGVPVSFGHGPFPSRFGLS